MQTVLSEEFIGTAEGEKAKEVIANCVHCGFCNATCPTYQILGDELDGPRGRIYLMKEMFEGKPVSEITQQHLDRCLTCRACETTCPSGVKYSELVDVGRRVMERKVERPLTERVKRWGLKEMVARPAVFSRAAAVGYTLKPLLPQSLKELLPDRPAKGRAEPTRTHARIMLVLDGCVQPSLTPQTNSAAIRVLDALGITLKRVPRAGCCGAVRHHLNDLEGAKTDARRNIDAWWPFIQSDQAEAIVSTASGCGVQLEHYADLLADDPDYAEKAQKIAGLSLDISLILQNELLAVDARTLPQTSSPLKIAVQEPCSFQHALRNKASISALLTRFGHTPVPVRDGHLCCGSAGTYSVLQPELSEQLRTNKIEALQVSSPDMIVTANVGCYGHLAAKAPIPIKHWIEVVDDIFSESETGASLQKLEA
ncbi:glycolate oxidase subunit GlcF [Paenalcaligenes niemegkensis]|uniref:glycolate oxidase subunit GlcF n=1 Tax=Paenalcaligenes niemegkensis TaxID=2895469 RepID=UPI001EE92DA6|nr:glycolate oxidase subunit GlcF [Paenalcaligenes niemegkensis]MCQ9618196.1 glycolate oxidase subunit GlcF [Paenalcaligenes niemegkensis]